MSKMDYERARVRDFVRERGGDPVDEPRLRGITNAQARELAKLQRAAGQPYTGAGMTEADAAEAIAGLRR